MKKVMACILFIGLGLAPSYSPVALASTSSVQGAPQKNARKAYLKQQRKQQRKAQKAQKKTVKKWRKRHHTATAARPGRRVRVLRNACYPSKMMQAPLWVKRPG